MKKISKIKNQQINSKNWKSKLKIGDEVLITAGKDKGRKGRIDKVYPKEAKFRVEGLNVYKRHVRSFAGEKGGIVEFSRPLPVANVALICPKCKKQTRVRYRVDKTGGKVRICAKCKRAIEVKKEK